MTFAVKTPKPKLPSWENKNLFEMDNESLKDVDSFEVDEDFLKKEKDVLTYEQKMKEAEKQAKENKDLFQAPLIENDNFEESTKESDAYSVEKDVDLQKEQEKEEEEMYKVPNEEVYQEINDDLKSEQLPIEIVDKNTLNIEANGSKHTITRNDLISYKKKYDLENGDEGNEMSRYVELGSIKGEREPMDKLSDEVRTTFSQIDEKMGGFNTIAEDY